MEYYILSILAFAIIIGFVLPIKQSRLNDLPRLQQIDDVDIDYHTTLKYNSDVSYCDDSQSNNDINNE